MVDLVLRPGLQKSTQDIIADASHAPLWQIALGIVLVSIYAFLAFLNFRDPVHSHTSLALVVIKELTFEPSLCF
jgi:hypothetical protein